MAIKTTVLTADQVHSAFEAFRAVSSVDAWRCLPDATRSFPDATWLDAIFTDDHHTALLVSNPQPIGVAIVQSRTGQVFWSYALPADYATMIDAICRWVVTNLNVVPWAYDERPDGERRKALRSRPDLVTVEGDPATEPPIVRVTWVGTRPASA